MAYRFAGQFNSTKMSIPTTFSIEALDWDKGAGLLPVIVQDVRDGTLLMQGYANQEALGKTLETGRATFYSRSRQSLWEKGETSGNWLNVQSVSTDCDQDSILYQVIPNGPTCHRGTNSCFDEAQATGSFIPQLEKIILDRKKEPQEGSYTNRLFAKGINKIAQKVGEEAVELVIEAKDDNKDLFLGEAADLMYHFLVLLAQKGYSLEEVEDVLRQRHAAKKSS